MATSTLVPIPHVRVLWRPEQYNRVANPGFEVDTTGWSVSAGINGAGTSITRITTDDRTGLACGQLVTTATAGSGVNYDLGAWGYYPEKDYGTIYAVTAWLRWVSGPRICKLVLGSQGTTSQRDELVITDLADQWTPYRLLWSPRGTTVITDAQLALVTITGEILTVNIDDVTLYQPEGFSCVENGTGRLLSSGAQTIVGWDASASYIASAPTTLTTTTTTPYVTDADGTEERYLSVTTTATDGSGVDYPLGDRRFVAGRTYRLRLVVRQNGGSGATLRLRFGSLGTSADRSTSDVTLGSAWATYTLDWTPTSDRTDALLTLQNAAASTLAFKVTHIEVYDSLDELGSALGDFSWQRGANFDGGNEAAGTFTLSVIDPAGNYQPANGDNLKLHEALGFAHMWRLGELAGTTAYDSIGTRNGTYAGTYTLGKPGSLAPGDADPSVLFADAGATSGQVQVADHADFDFMEGTGSFSIALRVKRTGETAGESAWLFRRVAANGGVALSWSADGNSILFRRDDSSTFDDLEVAQPTPSFDAWHSIVATYDGATMRLYFDGVLAGSRASTQNIGTLAVTSRIGGSGTSGLTGFEDEVALGPAVLSADDSRRLHAGPSSLYGSLAPGRPVLGRADYGADGYPLFVGTISDIAPSPFEARVIITGTDQLASIGRVGIRQDFIESKSYSDSRRFAISQGLMYGKQRWSRVAADILGYSRMDLANGIEGSTFFDGTADVTDLASYLSALNEATATVHYIAPRYDANAPWRYTTVDRAALTDTAAGTTIDEDFADITSHSSGFERLQNRRRVTWQSYDRLVLPPDVKFGQLYTWLARAADPAQAATTYAGDADPADPPYLAFTDSRIGDNTGIPEPEFLTTRTPFPFLDGYLGRWDIRGKGKRRRIVVKTITIDTTTRIYPDALVPFSMAAGATMTKSVGFAIPVAGLSVAMFDATVAATVYTILTVDPTEVIIDWWATAADDIEFFGLSGRPFLPREAADVEREDGLSILRHGYLDGPEVNAYVPSLGDAQGLGDFHLWRSGEARIALTLVDEQREFARILALDVTSHVTLSADRWRIASLPMVVRSYGVSVTGGAHVWTPTYDLEELPAHTAWFTLDSAGSLLDGSTVLAY